LHAAGKRAHIGICLVAQTEVGQDFIDPVIVVAKPEIAGLKSQRFTDGEKGVVDDFLRHNAKRLACFAELGGDVETTDGRSSFSGLSQTGENGDKSGLTGAVGPQQTKKLTMLDRQVDMAERLKTLATRTARQRLKQPAGAWGINLGNVF